MSIDARANNFFSDEKSLRKVRTWANVFAWAIPTAVGARTILFIGDNNNYEPFAYSIPEYGVNLPPTAPLEGGLAAILALVALLAASAAGNRADKIEKRKAREKAQSQKPKDNKPR